MQILEGVKPGTTVIVYSEKDIGARSRITVVETLAGRQERIDYCLVGEPSSEKQIGDMIKVGEVVGRVDEIGRVVRILARRACSTRPSGCLGRTSGCIGTCR